MNKKPKNSQLNEGSSQPKHGEKPRQEHREEPRQEKESTEKRNSKKESKEKLAESLRTGSARHKPATTRRSTIPAKLFGRFQVS